MRSTNTPQERPERLSMVTCYGKGFALCCVPLIAVSQPVTRYRPSLRTFAVTSKYLFSGVTAMLYKFLLLGKHRLNPITINFIHHNTKMNENNSQPTPFTIPTNLSYFNTALSNSAEPENSNDKTLAYSNTPLNACFFMRSTNTPQERPERLSMVTCYGKGFALCCVPLIAVSQPVTRYRPSLRTFAVTSKYLFSGVTAMLYKFLLLGKHRLNPITINFIHHNTKMNENNSQPTPFTIPTNLSYFNTALSNSAEPENSNDKTLAYSNTPLNACFFMRSTNTPRRTPKNGVFFYGSVLWERFRPLPCSLYRGF
ncbi:hypothetical protein [Avibacterium paragallinarum]|uniref:hypothetical protein n=1 Tax=Avibacterium paragallinarum TaxID=728 RepID=UPI00397D8C26